MRFFRDLAIAALIAAITALGVEECLCMAHLRYDASLFVAERERGFALRPYAHGWNESEGEAYVTINSDGMRDRERPTGRPPDTLRIAVIGSSEAEARQVPIEQTFEAVVRSELEKAVAGHRVDVLNFGVAGYGFAQEYLTLRDHVWKYDPQVVLLMLDAFTVLKNTRRLFPGDPNGTPFYVLRGGVLAPDAITQSAPNPSQNRLRWKIRLTNVMNESQLLSLMNQAKGALSRRIAELRAKGEKAPAHAVPADYMNRWPYLTDLPEMQEGWEIGEAFIDAMNRECRDHGAEFRIVITGMPMQTDPRAAERSAYEREMRIPSLDAPDRRIEAFAGSHGIPALPLAPALRAAGANHPVRLRFDGGHWTKAGHEVVGRAIADDLLSGSPAVQTGRWRADVSARRSR